MKTIVQNVIYILIAPVFAGIMTSCDTLQSEYYPGQKVEIKNEDLSRESIWTFNDKVYYVHMIGSNDFVAATLEWDTNSEEYRTETFPVILSEINEDRFFLSVQKNGLYTILRAVPAADFGDTWILHWVDGQKLMEDVQAKIVQAEKNDNDCYILKGTKAEQDEYISKNLDTLFPADHAAVARMIHEKKRK